MKLKNTKAFEIFKYLGPGFLVTVGFIDPGNWAANISAGSDYGYNLLWMVTLSTIMLIILQHNAAHLGIVTGLCLSEASKKYFNKYVGNVFLLTAIVAGVSTALAEILGAAIGLNMLFGLPITIGTPFTAAFVFWMVFANTYRKLEKWIITFVSLIGIAFIFELFLVDVSWKSVALYSFKPSFPVGSMLVVMSVLGAVVMPHNIFLHSEIIQSRQWNLKSPEIIKRQLKYEFTDTLTAMIVGFFINAAMIIVAAAVFNAKGIHVTELQQAQNTLKPLLGAKASVVFALALLFAGLSSSITAAMAGGSIFAGMFRKPLDTSDKHSRIGIALTIIFAAVIIYYLKDPFQGIIVSQAVLSIQLPLTVIFLIFLTSSKDVMGEYANSPVEKISLWAIAVIVIILNIMLLVQMFVST
ncbi:Nramp family divalent metal transporter [Candidatus Magnetomonas plexicatena]|uniref:Nramp family divalent metal transporter n=1 Tax=Candidatus Magnetomonas plexicatena TaxID=2552947 RepID=UPI001C78D663|nr:divalent metal cation transporter [Nitrospirales bacterium LBB_01]